MLDIPGNEVCRQWASIRILAFMSPTPSSSAPQSAADSDEYRARQMHLLRETCIPQACFLLLTVFNSTQQYTEV